MALSNIAGLSSKTLSPFSGKNLDMKRTSRMMTTTINWRKNKMDGLHIFLIALNVLFAGAAGSFAYASFNMEKKIETYEAWTELFRAEIDAVYFRLKMVDDRNLFEKDDDVGFVFSEILRVTKEFNETIK